MLPRDLPELNVALAVHVGELMRGFDVPRGSVTQDKIGLIFRAQHGALDMLVRLAEAGDSP